MHEIVLLLHSWNRWCVLAGALATLWCAGEGLWNARAWARRDRLAGAVFIGAFHLQAVLGVLLYVVLSPTVRDALARPDVMAEAAPRFWAVEHPTTMLLALAVAQIGRVLARRAPGARARHLRTLAATVVALALVLAAVPWPGKETGRPLFRSTDVARPAAALSPRTAR